jgi:hypothetical protein
LRNLRLDVGDATLKSFGTSLNSFGTSLKSFSTSLYPLDTLAQAGQLAWHFRQ